MMIFFNWILILILKAQLLIYQLKVRDDYFTAKSFPYVDINEELQFQNSIFNNQLRKLGGIIMIYTKFCNKFMDLNFYQKQQIQKTMMKRIFHQIQQPRFLSLC
ncbi:unnamed protein product [Paramecium sonneborni]|uniref:Transmembrane protein n=1 Tax=Paramecium sonneborni TaxID=65129 RepID=A0A8S1RVU8_9CILI|nr:unnamed protein product [Paramecium sonneborni]